MAFFCESVSYELDGNMNIQRIFDRIVLDPFVVLPTTCALKLVVGAARGDAEVIGFTPLGIRWESPKKIQSGIVNIPFTLPESVPFVSVSEVTATISELGVHWLDLFLCGKLLTRIPLSVTQGTRAMQRQPEAVQ
jgi:hypothetical protein